MACSRWSDLGRSLPAMPFQFHQPSMGGSWWLSPHQGLGLSQGELWLRYGFWTTVHIVLVTERSSILVTILAAVCSLGISLRKVRFRVSYIASCNVAKVFKTRDSKSRFPWRITVCSHATLLDCLWTSLFLRILYTRHWWSGIWGLWSNTSHISVNVDEGKSTVSMT